MYDRIHMLVSRHYVIRGPEKSLYEGRKLLVKLPFATALILSSSTMMAPAVGEGK